MKVKLIDYGVDAPPSRAHYNDAGADVRALDRVEVRPLETVRIPLGFGLVIPDGYAAFIFPRSGLSSMGITCETPPIDSGFRGEISAIVTNNSTLPYTIQKGDRIGQLVIVPVVICEFSEDMGEERGVGGFASSGK